MDFIKVESLRNLWDWTDNHRVWGDINKKELIWNILEELLKSQSLENNITRGNGKREKGRQDGIHILTKMYHKNNKNIFIKEHRQNIWTGTLTKYTPSYLAPNKHIIVYSSPLTKKEL